MRMRRRDVLRRLFQITRPLLFPLVWSTLFRMVALVLGIALFGLGGWLVGSGARNGGVVIAVLVGMALAKGVFRYLEQFAGHWVAFRALALLRGYFYDRLEPQAPAGTEGRDSGDLMNRVTKDVDRVEVFFAHTFAPLVTAVVVPVATVVAMGMLVGWAPAAALAALLIVAGAVAPFVGSTRVDEASMRIRVARGELAQTVTDSVQGVREVLAFGAEDSRLAAMDRIESGIATGQRTTGLVVASRRGLMQVLVAGGTVAMIGVCAPMVADGRMDLAHLGLALGIAVGAFAPVLAIEDLTVDIGQSFAAARRILEITEADPLVSDPGQPAGLPGRGGVLVNHVSFTYPGDNRPEVLHDVTVDIPVGGSCAIVGASGSGKSTLAALIARMWDVGDGAITLDSVDVRDAAIDDVRANVAFAQQEPVLFNDSVAANLRLAAPEASDDELREALGRVDLLDWLDAEPDGLATSVGERGERLSGGQRQRLCLARTLLRRAAVTILDEATSQLDTATEAEVLAGVREATAGRTLIVIAHRISTVAGADQVVVMDRGRVVETGRYADLMAADGALARLARREEPAAD